MWRFSWSMRAPNDRRRGRTHSQPRRRPRRERLEERHLLATVLLQDEFFDRVAPEQWTTDTSKVYLGAVEFGRDQDHLTSRAFDLRGFSPGASSYLSFYIRLGGGGWGQSPEPGDALLLEYRDSAETWQTLRSFDIGHSDVKPHIWNHFLIGLPSEAFHENFQFRYRPSGLDSDNATGAPLDYWYVDRVLLRGNQSPSVAFGPAWGTRTEGELFPVSWSASDIDGGLLSVRVGLYRDGELVRDTSLNANQAPFQEGSLPIYASDGPGNYYLVADVVDWDGARRTDRSEILLTLIEVHPSEPAILVEHGSLIDHEANYFSWTIDNPANDELLVAISKEGVGEIYRASASAAGSFNLDPYGAGDYTITFAAPNPENQGSSDGDSWFQQTISIADDDTDAPAIVLGGSSGIEDDSQDQHFTWDISDASGLSSVHVALLRNGEIIYVSNEASGSLDLNGLGPGDFAIHATAIDGDVDAAGDSLTTSSTRNVTVIDDDARAPTIVLDGRRGELSWRVTDGSGLSALSVVVARDQGSGPVAIYQTLDTSKAAGAFSVAAWGPGVYTITVTAVDGDQDWGGDALTNQAVHTYKHVSFDVKPGDGPNPINLGANGKLPAVVLTTSLADGDAVDFDASTIDPKTIQFGDPTLGKTVSPLRTTLEDVDRDGDLDLVMHFSMPELRNSGALDADSVDAAFSAESYDGAEVFGSCEIRMIAPKGKGKSGK